MKKGTKKVVVKKNAKRLLVFGFFSFAIIISVVISISSVINEISCRFHQLISISAVASATAYWNPGSEGSGAPVGHLP